jgi:threonine aldolase
MEQVDFRSDTVTHPTPEMREAMASAEVGDDVYGEDPSVNRLQAMAAELLGKEAALFVPSGTMANLVSVLAHCGRGDEIILGDESHVFINEAGGTSAFGGVFPHLVPNNRDGSLPLESIEGAVRPDDVHYPVSRLILIENTHNRCGGTPMTAEYTREVGALAKKHGLKLHIDGARIFNAAVELGVAAADLAEPADSVSVCLSKGLCAPVGSLICGDEAFITRAHRVRKALGGGMRQAGILAAAGIVALNSMIDRLAEDHRRARRLADGLRDVPGLSLRFERPATNMVFLDFLPGAKLEAADVVDAMRKEGLILRASGDGSIRLVVHYWIDDDAIERLVTSFKRLMAR